MQEELDRIAAALAEAGEVVARVRRGAVTVTLKTGGDPVTEVDTAVDAVLRKRLPRPGEGWLSEETADDGSRLRMTRVWVVDPLDGTREFVAGIPEWAISVALVEEGSAVAGGVFNPASGTTVLGAVGLGVWVDGRPAACTATPGLNGAQVLASRSEVARGEWGRFQAAPFRYMPVGSVAWKLALVAAGRADATWTLTPKHAWDVAAGVALVQAAGGVVFGLDGRPPRFNLANPRLSGLVACAPGLEPELRALLGTPALP